VPLKKSEIAMKRLLACATIPAALALAGCNESNDAEDRVEEAAEASAAAAGPTEAALGMSEQQLLDADLIDAAGQELGDVQSIIRGADGRVDRLLIEIEDSDPDRYVHVPIAGLTPSQSGGDWKLATTMTKQQLAAMPMVTLPGAASAAPIASAPAAK
jgi:hypothetical protein